MPPKLKTVSPPARLRRNSAARRSGSSPRYWAHERRSPRRRGASIREAKWLVLPFSDEDLISDNVGAEQSGGFLLSTRLHAAFFAHGCRSSRPPMYLPLTNTCGTVPRPGIAPTTLERSLWSSFTSE